METIKSEKRAYITTRARLEYNFITDYSLCLNNNKVELFGQCKKPFLATKDLVTILEQERAPFE